eukprot:74600-Pleurochrysis_carterae.AAC.1
MHTSPGWCAERPQRVAYKLSALCSVLWLAEQALGSVVVVVHDDKQASGDAEMSCISGSSRKNQELLLQTVLRSGSIAWRCWSRWENQTNGIIMSPKR